MNAINFLAVTLKNGSSRNVDIPTVTGNQLLQNGLNIAYFVLGGIAIVIIIMSGFKYLTANGDPAKAAAARQTILYAAIGLIVVVSAFAITNFVMGRI